MSKIVTILLVGIGGYGANYVNEIVDAGEASGVKIAGVVDVAPEKSCFYSSIKDMEIPVFATMEDFYQKGTADLAVISTPIHLHSQQICYALSKGSNVLCEKPLCATVQEAYEIMKMREQSQRFVAIGYQWSFSEPVLNLKKDILAGLFGRAKRLKTIILWQRDLNYYSRPWAGKRKSSDGRWILDSVANNATAHFLHNMFFLNGKTVNTSSMPRYVNAEIYRANRIENFDTSIITVDTEEDVRLMFYASHAAEGNCVKFFYEFEKGTVCYENSGSYNTGILADFYDGSTKNYGNPEKDHLRKLWICVEAVRTGRQIPCGLEAAMAQTVCINGVHESMPQVCNFPEDMVKLDRAMSMVWVEGLAESLEKCYADWSTPTASGASWAVPGKTVDMQGYRGFGG